MPRKPAVEQSQSQRQEMSVRMIPEQIIASTLLRMTAGELRAHLEAELENNPALDMQEVALPGTVPTVSLTTLRRDAPPRPRGESDAEDYLSDLPAREGLRDYLWQQFAAASIPEDHRVGRYLIECLDDNGYLGASLLDVAEELDERLERVEQVLHHIQEMDPPGIGARDLRECLALQLRAEGFANDPDAPLARRILESGWDLLTVQDYGGLARQFAQPLTRVQRSCALIRHRLVPYPGRTLRAPWRVPDTTVALVPDVCIHRTESGYQVEVIDARLHTACLCINREYEQIGRSLQAGQAQYSEEERQHVRRALDHARFLLNGLARRARTLQRVTEFLVHHQPAFIEGERRGLVPLTRREAARRLGLSESTVCRATIGKCVQLPTGNVVPFEAFFDAATAIKWRVEAILKAEDPGAPLKDCEIAERLHAEGIAIARRTVSKYREELGFPGYAERRRRGRGTPP